MTDEAEEGLDFGDDDPAPAEVPRQQYQPRDYQPRSTRPTHRLSVKEKDGKSSTVIGLGWLCDDGSVSIKLGPCVNLTSKDEVFIKLFPINPRAPF